MRRRRKHKPHANHERWLISYADFITLLFAFFVVMYSAAQVDKEKVGKLALAVQVAFQQLGVFPGDTTPLPLQKMDAGYPLVIGGSATRVEPEPEEENADLLRLQSELAKSLPNEISRREIDIRRVRDGLVISLREIGFFDSGSADLKARSLPAFGRIATLLSQRPYRIRIEGHTDDVPIHNARFASNWELSTARATELVRLLATRHGFAPSMLSAAGYAEYHPIAGNDSADGRAQNRRVDIVVLGKWPSTLDKGISAPESSPVTTNPNPEMPASGITSSPPTN